MDVPAKGGICPCIKSRYLMAVLASTGMGIIYGLKVGLHVAIVSMVNHTAVAAGDEIKENSKPMCDFNDTTNETTQDGPFNWSNTVQGSLLSSYFWGYIIAQIPGGLIAETYSAKWVMFFAVAINVLATLLTPVFSGLHYGAVLFLRVMQGIGGGVTFPSCHVLLAHWAPPLERSFMSNLVYAGTALGTVIFMLLSGVLAGGISWQAVFYIEGALSAIWLGFWAWLVSDTPQKQALMSQEERDYIGASLAGEIGNQAAHPPFPWRSVVKSRPFWAILVAHTFSNWGWYLLLIELPQFMKKVLQYNISANGLLSAMPFFVMWIFSMILSKVLDLTRSKGKISTTVARKIATGIASIIPAFCFIILNFVSCNRIVAVALLTIAITTMGGMFCGFLSNHIDISPNFAGTLMAITNTVASIPGIAVPIVVGLITDNLESSVAWRIIFCMTIATYLIEIIVYLTCGSGNVQSWNNVSGEATESQPLRANQK